MKIYNHVEIKARELEGRLLLSLVAAERGYDVYLGRVERKVLRGSSNSSIFHGKDLIPNQRRLRLLRDIANRQIAITSQDEENGLRHMDYTQFAGRRYSEESLALVNATLCWGNHDSESLANIYKGHREKFFVTGSPRVDLWRPEFDEYFQPTNHMRKMIHPYNRYVLIASSFGGILAQRRFWDSVDVNRSLLFGGKVDLEEFKMYERVAHNSRKIGWFVRAARRLSREFPDTLFVVRPHPIESEEGWKTIIGPSPNIRVIKDGSVSRWIRNAKGLIQTGCTTSMEAAICDTPVITFRPFRDEEIDGTLPNMIGNSAYDLDDLVFQTRLLLDNREPNAMLGKSAYNLIKSRFSSLDGPFAADRIVNAWDGISNEGPVNGGYRYNLGEIPLERVKGGFIELKQGLSKSLPRRSAHVPNVKFSPLKNKEINSMAEGMKQVLGRFDGVKTRVLGPSLCIVRAAR